MCCNTGVTIELSFYTGEFRCLLQLSPKRVAVCKGSGTSPEEAQASAARKALVYLKFATKN
jgi:hypothetical protein